MLQIQIMLVQVSGEEVLYFTFLPYFNPSKYNSQLYNSVPLITSNHILFLLSTCKQTLTLVISKQHKKLFRLILIVGLFFVSAI